MEWPIRFPQDMRSGALSVRSCGGSDAVGLFEALADKRMWEHMSRSAPGDADVLDDVVRSRLTGSDRATFTIRQRGRAVGITSVLFDAQDPDGVEIGVTLLDPGVWGTGLTRAEVGGTELEEKSCDPRLARGRRSLRHVGNRGPGRSMQTSVGVRP